MSGDVQPRRRKDKKKKKDGVEEVPVQQQSVPTVAAAPVATENITIHEYKERTTGGGLCAKLVFFLLLSAITVLIGLIITEHRGITDLDSVDSQPRFAQLFEGWIDVSLGRHEKDDHDNIEHSEEAEYDEDGDEEEEEEEEHIEEEEEEDHVEEEEEEEEEEEQGSEEEKEEEDEAEDDAQEVSNEADDEEQQSEEAADDEAEDEEEEGEADDDVELAEKEGDEESEEVDELAEEADEEPEEADEEAEEEVEESNEQEGEAGEEEEELDEARSDEQEDAEDEEADDGDASQEEQENGISDEQQEDDRDDAETQNSEEELQEPDVQEDDEPVKVLKAAKTSTSRETVSKEVKPNAKVLKEKIPKKKSSKEAISGEEIEDEEDGTYNMVVKFGVGAALLVVAYVVLIRKWRTEKLNESQCLKVEDNPAEAQPDMNRRDTIVVPPKLEDIIHDISNDEEYSEEDEEEEDEDYAREPSPITKFGELSSTYSKMLGSEPAQEREAHGTYEEEEEDEAEDEEEHDDYEDDDEEEQHVEEEDDDDLLKRLEAKYGKISGRTRDERRAQEQDDGADYEEEDRDEGFGSWKRIKVSSGNVPEESDSETEQRHSRRSGAQADYDFANITNTADWTIRDTLDEAQRNLLNDPALALTLFNIILGSSPSSPRAIYGRALSLDILADKKRSNAVLEEAINNYQLLLHVQDVPEDLFKAVADRCINRMRFRGYYSRAIAVHNLLIQRFPNEIRYRNQLAVTYLTLNKVKEARRLLEDTLQRWPADGFAQVHYGFILKTSSNDLVNAVKHLSNGLETEEKDVIDGRFFFHLGDALTRLGRNDEAIKVYSDAVRHKLFLSIYQRSLYNVDRLTGRPWWTREQTGHANLFEMLERKWAAIRDEGLDLLNRRDYFKDEAENLRDIGDWKQFELFARGVKNVENCKRCPVTCKLVDNFVPARNCKRGQVKFSVMHPGTHVWPHCGPTNCRLRAHLGLKVPPNTFIRVAEETRSWEDGKIFVFDDSFEHEVWHNGTSLRLILIVDIWHPEVTDREKDQLPPI